jgi:Na+-driven multidrug efflux pump
VNAELAPNLRVDQKTHANVFVKKAFRSFFIPSLFSCLGIAIGGLADCIFVGNTLGSVGLSAIIIGQPIYMLFNTISYSLSIGGSIRYAAALSEGRPEEGNRIFGNVLRFAIFVYLILCGLGLVFLPQVLSFLGAGAPGTELYMNCESLVRAQLILVPIMFCQGPLYYFVNCDNNPRLAAVAFVTSNTLDVLFNYIFVVVLDMGVAGSVYSTGLGAFAMICISMVHFIKKKGCLRLTWPKFDFAEIFKSFKTGFATSVQHIYSFVTILVCNRLLMSLGGNLGVAVFDIIFNVALLAASVYDAISMALQPMVSTFRSEHNRENIRSTLKEAFKISFILSLVLTGLLVAFPKEVCFAFGLREAAELAAGSAAVQIFAAGMLFAGVNMLMTYYYQAMEREFASYLLFTMRSLALFLLFGVLFARGSLSNFWWTYPCTEIASLAVLAIYNKIKGSWTYLSKDEKDVFTATLYSGTADLGAVEQEVNSYMERLDASPQQTYYVTMTVEEVCSVIHKNGFVKQDGYIQLTIVPHEDGTMTLHLRDNAKKFNPFDMNTDNISLEQGTGLDAIGVKMIKSKAKEFFYRRYAGFNTLVVRI